MGKHRTIKALNEELENLKAERKKLNSTIKRLRKRKHQGVEKFVAKRKIISNKIHSLQQLIRQRLNYQVSPNKRKSTVYQMFGKSCKDLTDDEWKKYNTVRKRKSQTKNKTKKKKGEK